MNEIKPDFFIWLGDNTGHNVWEPNKTEHLLGPRDLSHRMSEKYGKRGQMYPVMGNHEGIPCDEFDIHSDSHQWILNNLTDLWSNWLTPECTSLSLMTVR